MNHHDGSTQAIAEASGNGTGPDCGNAAGRKPRTPPFRVSALPRFRDEQIQHDAYFLWEAAGCPVGRDQEFWFAAQARLRHEAHAPAASHAAKTARDAQPPHRGIR